MSKQMLVHKLKRTRLMQWQKNITLLAVLRKYLHRIQSVISRKQVQELVLLFVNKLCCVLFVVVDDKKRKTTLGVKAIVAYNGGIQGAFCKVQEWKYVR